MLLILLNQAFRVKTTNIINSIKKVDKTKIFTKPEEVKLTLWQRLKKVLMGT